jgi:hypothetical protein
LEKTSEGFTVNKSKLEIASALIAAFTDGKMDREMSCLYAINGKLVELEHPVGCTHEILTCMYDNFVFSAETFMSWRDDNNPKEQEGKGMCQILESQHTRNRFFQLSIYFRRGDIKIMHGFHPVFEQFIRFYWRRGLNHS